jgi:hypothetical protein
VVLAQQIKVSTEVRIPEQVKVLLQQLVVAEGVQAALAEMVLEVQQVQAVVPDCRLIFQEQ